MYFLHLKAEEIYPAITIGDWKKYIEQDLEMRFSNMTAYKSPFNELIIKSGGLYGIWTFNGIDTTFTFEDGEITVIFCPETLSKMKEMKSFFKGYVFGDIGEEYF